MDLSPALYELALVPIERSAIGRERRRLVPAARGRVLDVGAGTGANFPLYAADARPVAVDVDPAMLARAGRRPGAPRLVVADAGKLPFPDRSFETVIFTLVLCSVPAPAAAVREARRVLVPGGRLVVVEHVKAPGPVLARAQRLLSPAWSRLAGGCRLDRDTAHTLEREGFTPAEGSLAWRGVLLSGVWSAPA
jgi:ubiquinone/menaquinone biosynthesis C-methylase UbiE